MGVSVRAYSGVKFQRAGGIEDVDSEEFADMGCVYLAPAPDSGQSEGLQAGIYSYLNSFEESIGSNTYFDEFRQKIAELANAPYPGTPAEKAQWKRVRFGELLYLPDSGGLMGPGTCNDFYFTLMGGFGDQGEPASKVLSFEHLETYQILERAAKLSIASYGDELFGVLLIS